MAGRAYLAYEKRLGDRPLEPSAAELTDRVLEITKNDVIYLDRGFREPFDPTDSSFFRHLAFGRTAVVFRTDPNFSFEHMKQSIKDAVADQELYTVGEASPSPSVFVIAHYKITGSPYVRDRIAFDSRFGHTIANQVGTTLFISSTEGLLPDYVAKTAKMVEPIELERIFSGTNTRMSQVSLLNSDLGTYSVRRRIISANSLSELAPSLADYAYFCSTAEGVIRNNGGQAQRNYVGFTRSRVTQRSGGKVEFDAYCEWAELVADTLRDGALKSDPSFDISNRNWIPNGCLNL